MWTFTYIHSYSYLSFVFMHVFKMWNYEKGDQNFWYIRYVIEPVSTIYLYVYACFCINWH